MKINCVVDLKMLDGKVIEKVSSKEFIANALMTHSFKIGSVIKKYEMAIKIQQNGEIDLDKEDYDLLLKALKNADCGVVPLIQAQLIIHVKAEASKEAQASLNK